MVVPSLKKSGPINVALNLCVYIKHVNPDVMIDLLAFNSGELKSEFEACCEQVFIVRPSFNLIKFLMKAKLYDIVHSHCLLPDFFSAFFVKKIKKISTLHNYINVDYVFDKGYLQGTLMSWVHKLSLKKMDRIIACSESVSTFVSREFNFVTTFVRNGVLEGRRGQAKINGQKYIMVGVFNKRKNHEVAIQGFVDARKENSELIILGDGPYFDEVRGRFYKEKNVKFMGNVANPRLYLAQSDVFLSSSCAEGLPMALIEAMSESLTYILSDIAPHREINNMDIYSGFVGSNEPEFFRDTISRLSDDDLIKMKTLSKIVYSENLTAEKMALGYLRNYKDMI